MWADRAPATLKSSISQNRLHRILGGELREGVSCRQPQTVSKRALCCGADLSSVATGRAKY